MSVGHAIVIGIAALVVAQLVIAVTVANYGANRGFPFHRLLLCAVFVPWPIVFLAIILAADRDEAAAFERRRRRMGWASEEAELARRSGLRGGAA